MPPAVPVPVATPAAGSGVRDGGLAMRHPFCSSLANFSPIVLDEVAAVLHAGKQIANAHEDRRDDEAERRKKEVTNNSTKQRDKEKSQI
jgi:hypothetical protein